MTDLIYETRAALMSGLADAVAGDLARAIAARGQAVLGVPGGTTPAPFLAALALKALDWRKLAVTLTDERWAPADHERSNERLLRATLLRGPAAAARFVPLYRDAPQPEDVLAAIEADIARHCQPFDALVLGMGEDAHTASLFPGADRLDEALSGAALVLPMRAPGAAEPRMTLTLRALLNARKTYVLITGARKRVVVHQAAEAGDARAMPVAAILQGARDLAVAWAA